MLITSTVKLLVESPRAGVGPVKCVDALERGLVCCDWLLRVKCVAPNHDRGEIRGISITI